jgi:hypothetical protein
MCSFVETAALTAVLEDDPAEAQDLVSQMTDAELLVFFRQLRELGLYVEAAYNDLTHTPAACGKHRRTDTQETV